MLSVPILQPMIPHTIHYFWFGPKPVPELALKCLESWKKYLPGYEIKLWNESNFDVHGIPYTAAAYDAGKYAFVSDYARFKVLYEEGGLYFDTDVEVIKTLDDIIASGPFMGRETPSDVAPGLVIGAEKGMDVLKEIMEHYEKDSFHDLTTVVERVTRILEGHGLRPSTDIEEAAGFRIYPPEYFCPVSTVDGSLHLTGNTRSIHHYAQSWVNPWHKAARKVAICVLGPRGKAKLSEILLTLRRKR